MLENSVTLSVGLLYDTEWDYYKGLNSVPVHWDSHVITLIRLNAMSDNALDNGRTISKSNDSITQGPVNDSIVYRRSPSLQLQPFLILQDRYLSVSRTCQPLMAKEAIRKIPPISLTQYIKRDQK